jgi:hypothetical protein
MQVNVLTDPEIGGTFFSWSLYYLTGHNNYYHTRSGSIKPLPSNPLTKLNNAHAFDPNRYNTPEQVRNITIPPDQTRLDVIYHHTASTVDFTSDQIRDTITHLMSMTDKNIIVTNKNVRFFRLTQASRSQDKTSNEAIGNEFIQRWFGKSYKQWNQTTDMSASWNLREFMALNLHPDTTFERITDYITSYDHTVYHIDMNHVWHALDDVMHDVISWLGWKVDNERFADWLKVYRTWRNNTMQKYKFHWYFDEIIDAILENNYINLKRFDLDIVQESMIQHKLIYKYDLNLAAYGVSQFDNTQQLHSLLEANIHPLPMEKMRVKI